MYFLNSGVKGLIEKVILWGVVSMTYLIGTCQIDAPEHRNKDDGHNAADEEVGQDQHVVLTAVSVDLWRHSQQRDGRQIGDQKRDGHRPYRHAAVGQQIFFRRLLFASRPAAVPHSDQRWYQQHHREHHIVGDVKTLYFIRHRFDPA